MSKIEDWDVWVTYGFAPRCPACGYEYEKRTFSNPGDFARELAKAANRDWTCLSCERDAKWDAKK